MPNEPPRHAENQQNTDELVNPAVTCADGITGTGNVVTGETKPHDQMISGSCVVASHLMLVRWPREARRRPGWSSPPHARTVSSFSVRLARHLVCLGVSGAADAWCGITDADGTLNPNGLLQHSADSCDLDHTSWRSCYFPRSQSIYM